MIELTAEQVQAMEQAQGPLHVVNPKTQEVYCLIPQDVYCLVRGMVGGPNRRGWDDPDLDVYEKYRKKP